MACEGIVLLVNKELKLMLQVTKELKFINERMVAGEFSFIIQAVE